MDGFGSFYLLLSIFNYLFRWETFLGIFEVIFFSASNYWEVIWSFVLTLIIFFILFFIGKVYLKISDDESSKNKLVSFSFWFSIIAIVLTLVLIFRSFGEGESFLNLFFIPFVFGFFILISFILLVINYFKNRNKN